jgi:glycosyltransferase involved in cell wall biosynthesis
MKSTFAKKAVLALLSLLSRRITWHFTTQDEYEEASRLVTIKNYVVIPNLIDDKTYFPSIERHYDFIFVGRVVRKKRLHLAIDFIQNQSQYGDVNCLFCLIPEDSDYLNECMNQVRSNTFRVDIMHNCAPEELKDYYRRSKFILVPSLNENHGHVIFEGLYNGCMPLVSTNMYYAKILSDTFCVNFDNLEDKSFLDLEVTDSVLQLEIDKSQEFLGIKRSRENYKKLLCDQ